MVSAFGNAIFPFLAKSGGQISQIMEKNEWKGIPAELQKSFAGQRRIFDDCFCEGGIMKTATNVHKKTRHGSSHLNPVRLPRRKIRDAVASFYFVGRDLVWFNSSAWRQRRRRWVALATLLQLAICADDYCCGATLFQSERNLAAVMKAATEC